MSNQRRPRRRLPVLAAAAAAVVGLTISPALIGSGGSVALAAVDPMTFPLTPTGMRSGLGDPVYERDTGFMAARYGSVLNGVSIVTDVEDEDFWTIADTSATTEIDGHQARVVGRTVYNGTSDSARAVTVIWRGDHDWTAVSESRRGTPKPVGSRRSQSPDGSSRSGST